MKIFDLREPHCNRARCYADIAGRLRYRCQHLVSVAFGQGFLL